MKPVHHDGAGALRGLVADGQTLMVGGFGLCGIPEALIDALVELKVTGLTCISNNAVFDGEEHVLEAALKADVSLVKAWTADEAGNLVFRKTARNFNQPMATAGRVCVAEVERIVPTGSLDPDQIHLPGVFVQRLLLNPAPTKHIEFRTVREVAA